MGLGRETLPQEQTNITGTKHFCAVGGWRNTAKCEGTGRSNSHQLCSSLRLLRGHMHHHTRLRMMSLWPWETTMDNKEEPTCTLPIAAVPTHTRHFQNPVSLAPLKIIYLLCACLCVPLARVWSWRSKNNL